MKNLLSFLALSIFLLLVCSCSSDDDINLESTLTADELVQTTWNVILCQYDDNGEMTHKEHHIFEFDTDKSGHYINGEGTGYSPVVHKFIYRINKRKIYFDEILAGDWTIIKKNKNEMVLQTYRPEECRAFFTKKY